MEMKNWSDISSVRLRVSGRYLELYRYQTYNSEKKAVPRGSRTKRLSVFDESLDDLMEKKVKYLMAVARNLRRLINTNVDGNKVAFVTLTFDDNEEDLSRAQSRFNIFIKLL